MKKISLLDDYGINDISNEEKIKGILNKISINSERIVELNLRHCIIDYPATSKLIDTVLFQLEKLNGQKELFIKISYILPEQTLLNVLLGDSRFFGIEAKKEMDLEDIKKKISGKLKTVNIFMEITILDRAGKTKVEYKYGE